jgi:glycosyltransferase involved in cell wall biosynthesis
MRKNMKQVSIVIPTKEEAGSLALTIIELYETFGQHIKELIVVDAGSKDRTVEIARSFACRVIIQDSPGYGAAVQLGIHAATGQFITFIDADGSYNPIHLNQMLKELDQQDAVFCTRYHPDAGSDDDTWLRYCGNIFFTYLLKILFNVKLSDALHLYVLAKTDLVKKLPMQSQGFDWCVEFPIRIAQNKLRYKEIPARERPRTAGVSKVNAFADGYKILVSMLTWKIESLMSHIK